METLSPDPGENNGHSGEEVSAKNNIGKKTKPSIGIIVQKMDRILGFLTSGKALTSRTSA